MSNLITAWGTVNNTNLSFEQCNSTTVDFGSTPVDNATFVITDANVVAGSLITGQVSYVAPTGKDLDEIEMDSFQLNFQAGSGQFTLFMRGLEGYLADKFVINYAVY